MRGYLEEWSGWRFEIDLGDFEVGDGFVGRGRCERCLQHESCLGINPELEAGFGFRDEDLRRDSVNGLGADLCYVGQR